mmetsp:Transcript_42208/g.73360  ORF Transcript_42208/g.73360 Transcript_42208/m.73360 type:complete len:236 (-) Transcript_42208:257-964(-)
MLRMQFFPFLAQLVVLISGDPDHKAVSISMSTNFTDELIKIGTLLQVKPGMTYCEMGAGDGKFMVALGNLVMPGGKVMATEADDVSVVVLQGAAWLGGIDVSVIEATDAKMGLPAGSCDVIMSRMVYHMIKEPVAVGTYLPQLKQALKPGGKMLILDHDPDDCTATTRGPNSTLYQMMQVVPRLQEIREFTSVGLALVQMLEWPWLGKMEHGYALMWMDPALPAQDQMAHTEYFA